MKGGMFGESRGYRGRKGLNIETLLARLRDYVEIICEQDTIGNTIDVVQSGGKGRCRQPVHVL